MIFDEKWDRRFLELARHVASWSKDPSTKVGAVLVDEHRHIVATGYNGFPRGVMDTEERYADRDLKYRMVVHAEVNALAWAGELARGATLYVWPSFDAPPICNECAKVAIQMGVVAVVGYTPTQDDSRHQRWLPSILTSRQMFEEAGIVCRMLTEHV